MNAQSESREELLEQFRRRFGIEALAIDRFNHALTHRSYAFENGNIPDNERLEFLGDALLSAIASDYLCSAYPEADEGKLSKLRSRLVSRSVLGKRAGEMGLGDLLLLGRGERQTGGSHRRSVVGSALEAVVAAIFLHTGHEPTERFVREHIIEPLAENLDQDLLYGDFKSALQEWAQQTKGCVPVYDVVDNTGPDHAKAFTVEVTVQGKKLGRGEGRRIKIAENHAAEQALKKIAQADQPVQA